MKPEYIKILENVIKMSKKEDEISQGITFIKATTEIESFFKKQNSRGFVEYSATPNTSDKIDELVKKADNLAFAFSLLGD